MAIARSVKSGGNFKEFVLSESRRRENYRLYARRRPEFAERSTICHDKHNAAPYDRGRELVSFRVVAGAIRNDAFHISAPSRIAFFSLGIFKGRTSPKEITGSFFYATLVTILYVATAQYLAPAVAETYRSAAIAVWGPLVIFLPITVNLYGEVFRKK